jgi:hypothetical protein
MDQCYLIQCGTSTPRTDALKGQLSKGAITSADLQGPFVNIYLPSSLLKAGGDFFLLLPKYRKIGH